MVIDYIIIDDEEDRITAIGYLIRDSQNGFTGFMQDGVEILAIDRDDTENLILKGVKFRYRDG